jgi:hypothetical protein
MRPVTRGPVPATYVVPLNQTWDGTSTSFTRIALNKLFNGSKSRAAPASITLTTAACLQMAWDIANGTVAWNANAMNVQRVLMARFGNLYGDAGIPLTVAIGSFCSYCESYSSGGLAVEHVVPKSPFPALTVEWTNFLLSCVPCNSIKNNRPSYAEVTAIAPASTNPTNIADCRTTVRAMYEFPDDNATAFQDYQQVLWYNNAGTWTPITLAQSVNLANAITSKDLINRRVMANIPGLSAVPVEVRAVISCVAATPADAMTNNLCLLNRTPPALDPLRTSDQRVYNRTVAWFDTLTALTVLMGAAPAAFNSFWRLFVLSAQNSGFWSVWITLLSKSKDPTGANLATRFLADPTIAAACPGTNSTNIVYPTRP